MQTQQQTKSTITLRRVESSQIKAMGYVPAEAAFYIEFPVSERTLAKEPGKRSIYVYSDVDFPTAKHLLSAKSKGIAFGETLKSDPDRWPFRRLTMDEIHELGFEYETAEEL